MNKTIKTFSLNLIFILGLATVLFTVAFLITGLRVEADGGDSNVFGWAWSENIGWISFNPDILAVIYPKK